MCINDLVVLQLNILIVLVLYKKKLNEVPFLIDAFNVNHEVDIYIHDNSPDPQVMPFVNGLIYFHDSKNTGVSHAYNCGFEIAKHKGKECVLLLDQDTNFKINDLIVYEKAYMMYSHAFIYAPMICDQKKEKIYSPAFLRSYVGHSKPYSNVHVAQPFLLDGHSVINSGLMIPLTIFEMIGGYNENIKLDFSDVYFLEKYKEKHNQLILLPLELIHSLSGDEGYNKTRELHRFKFYCEGAVFLGLSLRKSTAWTVLRRMLRLLFKYHTLQPVFIFFDFYLLRKNT